MTAEFIIMSPEFCYTNRGHKTASTCTTNNISKKEDYVNLTNSMFKLPSFAMSAMFVGFFMSFWLIGCVKWCYATSYYTYEISDINNANLMNNVTTGARVETGFTFDSCTGNFNGNMGAHIGNYWSTTNFYISITEHKDDGTKELSDKSGRRHFGNLKQGWTFQYSDVGICYNTCAQKQAAWINTYCPNGAFISYNCTNNTGLCCDIRINSLTSDKSTFNPGAGDTVSFSSNVTGSYNSSRITVAGRTLSGNTWDGKNASGQVVAPGNYPVTLTVTNSTISYCSTTKSINVTVIQDYCQTQQDNWVAANCSESGAEFISYDCPSDTGNCLTCLEKQAAWVIANCSEPDADFISYDCPSDTGNCLTCPEKQAAWIALYCPAGNLISYDCPTNTGECCDAKITSFTSNKPSFNPGAGDTVSFSSDITGTYDSPEISVAGRTLSGNSWDGKTATGKLVNPGTYYVTLTVTSVNNPNCTRSQSIPIIVIGATPNTSDLNVCNFGSSANLASGNLSHSQELFALPGAGLTTDLTLFYNSTDPYPSRLGAGWSHSYDYKLSAQTNGDVLIRSGDGVYRLYKYTTGAYQPPRGDYSTLSRNPDNTYLLTRRDGQRYLFAADGLLLSITDRNNNAMQFAYSGSQLTTITNPVGLATSLTYDTNGKLAAITTPDGRVYQFNVGADRLLGVTYPGGRQWVYTYNYFVLLTKTDPVGNVTSYTYDGNFRVKTSSDPADPANRVRTINYPTGTATLKTSQLVEKDGGVWSRTYDTTNGNLLSKTDPLGNVTSYTYDPAGNLLTETGPDNAVTSHTYDAFGNRLSTTDPGEQLPTTYTYNSFGQITSITTPANDHTDLTYDEQGNLLGITTPTGEQTAYGHNQAGWLTSVTNPAGGVTSLSYDQFGNLASLIDPYGAETLLSYDAAGRLLQLTNPAGGVSTFTYDTAGNLTGMTDPGGTSSAGYDANGNPTSRTDANHHTTSYEFNAKGQVVKSIDALGQVTLLNYDGGSGCATCAGGVDKLTTLTDPNGQTTAFAYDTPGHLVRKTDPLGQTTSFTYNSAGRLQSKTDRNNLTIGYDYTPDGKLAAITYPDSSQTTFDYDQRDNLSQRHDSLGTTNFNTDAAARPTSLTDANGFVTGYQYNSAGNLVLLTYPDGKTVSYTYDLANRLTSVRADWLARTATYSYDTAGRLAGLSQFNGTQVSYGYDNANRLTDLRNLTTAAGNVIAAYHFTLDGNGNRTQATQEVPLEPLTGSGDQAYTYNPGKNRLLHAGSESFTYDNEGQLASGYGEVYSFDFEHRLVGSGNTLFEYDGAGNRLRVTRGGITGKYIYDAFGNLIAEADADNVITRYYIHGAGLLAMATPAGAVYCYHFDGTGNTVAMTDPNKALVNRYAYEPFGQILQEQEEVAQPFKYVGQFGVMADPNGFYYMRARYYDPKVRRFISEDPIGFAGGDLNLFGYVQNNPVNRIDPEGLAWRQIRPLDLPILKYTTIGPFHHDRFIYDDGTDFGFYGNNRVRPDNPLSPITNKYQNTGEYLDDDILREAESFTRSWWDNNPAGYIFGIRDCQHYADSVLREYYRILNERKNGDKQCK